MGEYLECVTSSQLLDAYSKADKDINGWTPLYCLCQRIRRRKRDVKSAAMAQSPDHSSGLSLPGIGSQTVYPANRRQR